MNSIAFLIRIFTGVQGRWLGCTPASTQRLYFANHTSHFDFLVLWAVLSADLRKNTTAVGAADYWTKGRIRRWLAQKIFKIIPIEREHITPHNNPLNKLTEAIDSGKSLIIFPEGGRNGQGDLKEFKCGLYHLAKARPNIDYIPVYIDNANRVLPKGEFLPIPLICSVTFGSSIKLQENESKEHFLERTHTAVKELYSHEPLK